MRADLLPINLKTRDAELREMGEGRSEGIHLSDIYSYMRIKGLGKTYESGDFSPFFAHLGFVFERTFALSFAESAAVDLKCCRVDPFQVDGIHMSPDFYMFEDEDVLDAKLTFKSMRPVVESANLALTVKVEYPTWMWQGMGYVYGMRREGWKVNGFRLVVLYIRGDYRADWQPQPRQIRLTWADDELEDFWGRAVQIAERLRADPILLQEVRSS